MFLKLVNKVKNLQSKYNFKNNTKYFEMIYYNLSLKVKTKLTSFPKAANVFKF